MFFFFNIYNGKTIKTFHKEYEQRIQPKNKALLDSINLTLFQELDSNQTIPAFVSKEIQPAANQDEYTDLLLFPPDYVMPIKRAYFTKEQRGLGTISHEYQVENGHLHIRSYFNQPNSEKKLISHIKGNHERNTLYSAQEDLNLSWNGGRYAKSSDNAIIPIWNGSSSLPYPPVTPYPAERDNLASFEVVPIEGAPTDEELEASLEQDQQQERVNFTRSKLYEQAQPSTNSVLFKHLQEMDKSFKMLDCLLALIHNDNYNNDAFAPLKSKEITHLKDHESVVNFLGAYIDPKSGLAQSVTEHMPHYLNVTQESLKTMLDSLNSLGGLKPQCHKMQSILDNVQSLMNMYRNRALVPAPAPSSVPRSMHDANEIQLLKQENLQLKAIALATQKDVQEMRLQMQAMMNMMMEMHKGKDGK